MKKGILLILIIILLSFVNSSLWSEQETYISKTIVTIPWGDSNGQVPLYEEKVEMNDGTFKIQRHTGLIDFRVDNKGKIFLLINGTKIYKFNSIGVFLSSISLPIDKQSKSICRQIAIDDADNIYSYIVYGESNSAGRRNSKLVKLNAKGDKIIEQNLPVTDYTSLEELHNVDDEIFINSKKIEGIGPKAKVLKPAIKQSYNPDQRREEKGLIYEVHPTGWSDKLKGIYIKNQNGQLIKQIDIAHPLNIEWPPDVIELLKIDSNNNIFIIPEFYSTVLKQDTRDSWEIQKYNNNGVLLSRIIIPKNSWATYSARPQIIDNQGNIYYIITTSQGLLIKKAYIQ